MDSRYKASKYFSNNYKDRWVAWCVLIVICIRSQDTWFCLHQFMAALVGSAGSWNVKLNASSVYKFNCALGRYYKRM